MFYLLYTRLSSDYWNIVVLFQHNVVDEIVPSPGKIIKILTTSMTNFLHDKLVKLTSLFDSTTFMTSSNSLDDYFSVTVVCLPILPPLNRLSITGSGTTVHLCRCLCNSLGGGRFFTFNFF